MNLPEALELPADRQSALRREFPATARAWIANWPSLVRRCVDRWQLTLVGTATGGLPINMVFFATDPDGRPCVLKLGHPHPEQVTEMIALRYYNGRHTPTLLDCDESLGALLIERIMPGETYRSQSSDRSRSERRLDIFRLLPSPRPAVEGLPDYASWIRSAFSRFRTQAPLDHLFRQHLDHAEAAFHVLQAQDPEPWMLHGDLHHENLLIDDERGLVAIDPKGVIGPRVLECGRYLHNFISDELGKTQLSADDTRDAAAVIGLRIEAFAEVMSAPPPDIARAGYVDAVLGSCWTLNSGGDMASRAPAFEAARLALDQLQ